MGTAGIDILSGPGGNDRLTGLAGADLLDGVDTVNYDGAAQGVGVDLLFNKGSAGDALGDTLLVKRRGNCTPIHNRESVSQALDRIRRAARQGKKARFTSLLHHIEPAMLRTAFYATKRDAAPGVDGLTSETYEQDLDRRIGDLHASVKTGAYRALPSRRSYIPKEDGGKRPLAVASLEDKIVQRATAMMLNAIYEEDFLGFS